MQVLQRMCTDRGSGANCLVDVADASQIADGDKLVAVYQNPITSSVDSTPSSSKVASCSQLRTASIEFCCYRLRK